MVVVSGPNSALSDTTIFSYDTVSLYSSVSYKRTTSIKRTLGKKIRFMCLAKKVNLISRLFSINLNA